MNKNEGGFLHLLMVIILVIIALCIAGASWSAVSRAKRTRQANADIGGQLDVLSTSASLKSKNCNGGDGVDSGPQCRYTYMTDMDTIKAALQKTGFTSSRSSNSEIATFYGGNPKLQIIVLGSEGSVTLDATESH